MGKQKKELNCRLGTVGGQAVLEGVMMKSKKKCALSLRMPDGSIKTSVDDVTSIRTKYKFFNIPIIRGVVSMIETLKLSYSTLSKSAEAMATVEATDEKPSKFEQWIDKTFGEHFFKILTAIATVLALALGFFLFSFLPSISTKGLDILTGNNLGWFKNLIEGLIKIAIFLFYIWVVSLMKDIKRTYQYHGAEHKSIFCYESGQELTPENAQKFKRFHPRCGTSFMFVMLALSILVYSLPFITWENMFLRVGLKLLMLPVIVGIGFEFLMYAGKHDNVVIRILSAPGLWIQRITTKEPTLEMLEVAIVSLKASLPEEFPPEVTKDEEKVESDSSEEENKAEPEAEKEENITE